MTSADFENYMQPPKRQTPKPDHEIPGVYRIWLDMTGATQDNITDLMEVLMEAVEESPLRFEGASGGPVDDMGGA